MAITNWQIGKELKSVRSEIVVTHDFVLENLTQAHIGLSFINQDKETDSRLKSILEGILNECASGLEENARKLRVIINEKLYPGSESY